MTMFTFVFCILTIVGNLPISAQEQFDSKQEYKKLHMWEREFRKDATVNVSSAEAKYLSRLEQMKTRLQAFEKQSIETKELKNLNHSVEYHIFKLTTAKYLLDQSRTKAIADSLRNFSKIPNYQEANKKRFKLLSDYELTLVQEACLRYSNNEQMRKVALDSVAVIMKALGTIPERIVKRTTVKLH